MVFEDWISKTGRPAAYAAKLASDGGNYVANFPTYSNYAALVRDVVVGDYGPIAAQFEFNMRNTNTTYGQALILGMGADPVASISLASGPIGRYNWTLNTDGSYVFKDQWNVTYFSSAAKIAQNTDWHKFLIQMWRQTRTAANMYVRVKFDDYEWDPVHSINQTADWFTPAKSGLYIYIGPGTASVPVYVDKVILKALAAQA